MKHKNPAPQTREMDIIVWCHNIHFKRQPQQHPGCHGLEPSSAWGRSGTQPGGWGLHSETLPASD